VKKSWVLVSMVAFASLAAAQEGALPRASTAPEAAAPQASVASPESAAPQSEAGSGLAAGKMLLAANGARLGAIYRVTDDGSAQLIVDGKMVTIPAATLSVVNGKPTTSLSKSEIRKLH